MPIFKRTDAQGNPLYTNIPSLAGLSPEDAAAQFTASSNAQPMTAAESMSARLAQQAPMDEAQAELDHANRLTPYEDPSLATASPVSTNEPSTWGSGYMQGLKKQFAPSAVVDRVKQFLSGAGTGLAATVPNAVRGVGAVGSALLHPSDTASTVGAFLNDPSGALSTAGSAAERVLSDPEAIGELTGNTMGGMVLAPGIKAIAPSIARGTGTAVETAGRGLEAAGSSDFANMLGGYGAMGEMFQGSPMKAAAMAAAPPAARGIGKAAQVVGKWLKGFGTDEGPAVEPYSPNISNAANRARVSSEVPGSSMPESAAGDNWYGARKTAAPTGGSGPLPQSPAAMVEPYAPNTSSYHVVEGPEGPSLEHLPQSTASSIDRYSPNTGGAKYMIADGPNGPEFTEQPFARWNVRNQSELDNIRTAAPYGYGAVMQGPVPSEISEAIPGEPVIPRGQSAIWDFFNEGIAPELEHEAVPADIPPTPAGWDGPLPKGRPLPESTPVSTPAAAAPAARTPLQQRALDAFDALQERKRTGQKLTLQDYGVKASTNGEAPVNSTILEQRLPDNLRMAILGLDQGYAQAIGKYMRMAGDETGSITPETALASTAVGGGALYGLYKYLPQLLKSISDANHTYNPIQRASDTLNAPR